MSPRVIHRLPEADPFRPFTLVIGDHTEVAVDRPGQVTIEGDTASITYSDGRVHVVDLRLVPMVDIRPGRRLGGG